MLAAGRTSAYYFAMRALAILAFVLLSGCWMGARFYRPSDARPIIAPGVYRVSSASEDPHPDLRVSILADGMTQFDSAGASRPAIIGFTPLGGEGRRFVFWQNSESPSDTLYGLLEREEDGSFLIELPSCDATASLARRAGATVERQPLGIPACRFRNRASLEAALGQLRPDPNDPNGGAVRISSIDHGDR